MANCVEYCNTSPIGTPDVIGCGNDPVGGMSAIIWLACNHTITDPSNSTQINSNISAGKAWLFQRVSVELTEPSPVTQESLVPCETEQLVTYDRELTYVNPNVNATNIAVHDKLFDGRSLGGALIYECGSDDDTAYYVTWIDSTIRMTGGRVVPMKNTEFQKFSGKGKWRSKKNPMRYSAPTSVPGFGS
jgi:hypothetical protein